MMNRKLMYALDLQQFADVMNATTSATLGNDLSPEMKIFYDKNLIRLAEPELVHDRFGQKKPIPRGNGKTIEFRRFSKLPKALTPLTEGVAPDGQALNVTAQTATVNQYGAYLKVTDVLQLTAFDPIITEATRLIADQAAKTLDTITREVLNGGTNVQYAEGQVSSRGTLTSSHLLTVKAIRMAVRTLRGMDAPKINGNYVGIIHPDISFDLMSDSKWEDWHKYTTPDNMYDNEIGRIAGVRFVESTEAKVFSADDLTEGSRTLTVNGNVSANATTAALNGTFAENELAGRVLLIDGRTYTVASNTASTGTATVTLKSGEKFAAITSGATVYPGEAGAAGADVYSTLIIGGDAYGVTEVTGGGLEMIIKSKEQAGGPLNQYSTIGWKAIKTAERLIEEYMVRIETGSTK